MKRRPVYSANHDGETVITGYEYRQPTQSEMEAEEAGIRLAREIGREAAARRAPLKKKLMNYLVGEEEAE